MLPASIKKNDSLAKGLIYVLSFVVFAAVVLLKKIQLDISVGFDIHIFAKINAVINSAVSILLFMGLVSVKKRKYLLHKRMMGSAIILSTLFLICFNN